MKSNCAVLLASYNGESYIVEQIQSILNQKNVNITLYISDDNSTDKTLEKINSLESNNIIILPNKQGMGSAAQNFFRLVKDVDFSRYDYIALSDQDDVWKEHKIEKALSSIEEKKLDGYASNVMAFWEDGRTTLINKSANEVKWDYLFSSAGAGCTIVLKSEIAEKFKKLLIQKHSLVKEIDIHHDWLIYAYIRSKGLKWWVDPEPSMFYRQHSNNELGANNGLSSFISRWKKARGGWYGKEILRIATICDSLDIEPIKDLQKNTYFSKVKLSFKVFNLRKRKKEALILGLMLIIPGFKINIKDLT